MKSLQNFIIVLTIATLASDGIASPVPEELKVNPAPGLVPFGPGCPGEPCIFLDPELIESIKNNDLKNYLKSDEDTTDYENDQDDIDLGKRGSGSYLFRSRRAFDEEPRLQPRSGMYLLRTRKSVFGPRATRGNYLFRTRKSMDRYSRGGGNKYLFRTRKADELMNRMSTRGKGYLFRTK